MAGNPSGNNTEMAGTAAKPPAMATMPTSGSISATKQPTFSEKGTHQGTRKRSGSQHNGAVSTRRLPIRGPAHATPTTAATTTGRMIGHYGAI